MAAADWSIVSGSPNASSLPTRLCRIDQISLLYCLWYVFIICEKFFPVKLFRSEMDSIAIGFFHLFNFVSKLSSSEGFRYQ
ncbi:unnamed protein product [Thelazia callipaeda]|uniref:Ovule protein n=1 Tax=Thelazia callipaeda TaxID=103827 RepID=A0A0N5CTG9_THECL|nr:unnamed protein product [Thelazia callipaeda]